MNTYRSNAIWMGVLYIIGTVAGILSAVSAIPILDAPDYVTKLAGNENQLIIGALFVMTMGLSLAMVPVVAYPVLKKHNETLAIGYVLMRGALETLMYFVTVMSWLLLVAAPDLGTIGLKAGEVSGVLLELVFSLGALMLYVTFYQSNLIPRWLAGWGLVAAVLYLTAGTLRLFGLADLSSSLHTMLEMPMALQEMVMAVWLIAKGFNPKAVTAAPAYAANVALTQTS